ncbi:ribosome biogenesis protein ytm1 [Microbotryomycetes sp. JL221]|nr:ribosome biogenesis protein ytm1 [Microbotryomycetes sp. JL221]
MASSSSATMLGPFLTDIGALAIPPVVKLPSSKTTKTTNDDEDDDTIKPPFSQLFDRLEQEIMSINDQTRVLLEDNWPQFQQQVANGNELVARMEDEQNELADVESQIDGDRLPNLVEKLTAHSQLAQTYSLTTHTLTILTSLLSLHNAVSTVSAHTTSGSLPLAVASLRDLQSALQRGAAPWIEQTDAWTALRRWGEDEQQRLEAAILGAFEACFEFVQVTSTDSQNSFGGAKLTLRSNVAAAPKGDLLEVPVLLQALEDVFVLGGGTKRVDAQVARVAKHMLKYFVTPLLEANGQPDSTTSFDIIYEDDVQGAKIAILRKRSKSDDDDNKINQDKDVLTILADFLTFFSKHTTLLPPSPYAANFTANLTPIIQQLVISSHLVPSLPSTISSLSSFLPTVLNASAFERDFLPSNGYFAFLPKDSRGRVRDEARVIQSWVDKVDRHWAKKVGDSSLEKVRSKVKNVEWDKTSLVNVKVEILVDDSEEGLEKATQMIDETEPVSNQIKDVIEVAQSLIKEAMAVASASFKHPTFTPAAPHLLSSFASLLSLYRAIAPVHHESLLKSSARIAIQFANDTDFIAREFERLWIKSEQDRQRVFVDKLSEEGDKSRKAVEQAIARTKDMGKNWRKQHIDKQRQSLMSSLDDADQFLYISDDVRYAKCEKACKDILALLRRLADAWKPVLNRSTYYTTLGSLVNDVLQRMLDEIVEEHLDISEQESIKLNKLCKIMHDVEQLFDGDGVTSVGAEVQVWFKFVFLSELLEASMADIMFLFDDGHLVDFEPQTIAKLVRALFADSPLREQNLLRISQGHPAPKRDTPINSDFDDDDVSSGVPRTPPPLSNKRRGSSQLATPRTPRTPSFATRQTSFFANTTQLPARAVSPEPRPSHNSANDDMKPAVATTTESNKLKLGAAKITGKRPVIPRSRSNSPPLRSSLDASTKSNRPEANLSNTPSRSVSAEAQEKESETVAEGNDDEGFDDDGWGFSPESSPKQASTIPSIEGEPASATSEKLSTVPAIEATSDAATAFNEKLEVNDLREQTAHDQPATVGLAGAVATGTAIAAGAAGTAIFESLSNENKEPTRSDEKQEETIIDNTEFDANDDDIQVETPGAEDAWGLDLDDVEEDNNEHVEQESVALGDELVTESIDESKLPSQDDEIKASEESETTQEIGFNEISQSVTESMSSELDQAEDPSQSDLADSSSVQDVGAEHLSAEADAEVDQQQREANSPIFDENTTLAETETQVFSEEPVQEVKGQMDVSETEELDADEEAWAFDEPEDEQGAVEGEEGIVDDALPQHQPAEPEVDERSHDEFTAEPKEDDLESTADELVSSYEDVRAPTHPLSPQLEANQELEPPQLLTNVETSDSVENEVEGEGISEAEDEDDVEEEPFEFENVQVPDVAPPMSSDEPLAATFEEYNENHARNLVDQGDDTHEPTLPSLPSIVNDELAVQDDSAVLDTSHVAEAVDAQQIPALHEQTFEPEPEEEETLVLQQAMTDTYPTSVVEEPPSAEGQAPFDYTMDVAPSENLPSNQTAEHDAQEPGTHSTFDHSSSQHLFQDSPSSFFDNFDQHTSRSAFDAPMESEVDVNAAAEQLFDTPTEQNEPQTSVPDIKDFEEPETEPIELAQAESNPDDLVKHGFVTEELIDRVEATETPALDEMEEAKPHDEIEEATTHDEIQTPSLDAMEAQQHFSLSQIDEALTGVTDVDIREEQDEQFDVEQLADANVDIEQGSDEHFGHTLDQRDRFDEDFVDEESGWGLEEPLLDNQEYEDEAVHESVLQPHLDASIQDATHPPPDASTIERDSTPVPPAVDQLQQLVQDDETPFSDQATPNGMFETQNTGHEASDFFSQLSREQLQEEPVEQTQIEAVEDEEWAAYEAEEPLVDSTGDHLPTAQVDGSSANSATVEEKPTDEDDGWGLETDETEVDHLEGGGAPPYINVVEEAGLGHETESGQQSLDAPDSPNLDPVVDHDDSIAPTPLQQQTPPTQKRALASMTVATAWSELQKREQEQVAIDSHPLPDSSIQQQLEPSPFAADEGMWRPAQEEASTHEPAGQDDEVDLEAGGDDGWGIEDELEGLEEAPEDFVVPERVASPTRVPPPPPRIDFSPRPVNTSPMPSIQQRVLASPPLSARGNSGRGRGSSISSATSSGSVTSGQPKRFNARGHNTSESARVASPPSKPPIRSSTPSRSIPPRAFQPSPLFSPPRSMATSSQSMNGGSLSQATEPGTHDLEEGWGFDDGADGLGTMDDDAAGRRQNEDEELSRDMNDFGGGRDLHSKITVPEPVAGEEDEDAWGF